MLYVICYMLYVRCYMLYVRWYMVDGIWYMVDGRWYMLDVIAQYVLKLKHQIKQWLILNYLKSKHLHVSYKKLHQYY